MLQFLADLLSDSARLSECSAAMFGGDILKLDQQLGRSGAEALAPYLKAHATLRCLELGGTELGNDGLRVLAEALLTNTTVAHLDVSQNNIADGLGEDKLAGVAALYKLMKGNR
jgi:hypothetical protein